MQHKFEKFLSKTDIKYSSLDLLAATWNQAVKECLKIHKNSCDADGDKELKSLLFKVKLVKAFLEEKNERPI